MTRCAAVGIRMTLFASVFAYTVTALVLPPLVAFVREYTALVLLTFAAFGVAAYRWARVYRHESYEE